MERKSDFSDVIAVTNRGLCERPFLEQIGRICVKAPRAVLLREKDLPEAEYEKLAVQVLAICRKYNIACILHKYPGTAERLGVRSIQLPIQQLRELSVEKRTCFEKIGCSVHSVQEAREAELLGAAYLIVGHIYETDCKKGVPPRGISFLREVCANVKIPVYAIGGIHMEGGRICEVKEAGATGACLMSDMMRL